MKTNIKKKWYILAFGVLVGFSSNLMGVTLNFSYCGYKDDLFIEKVADPSKCSFSINTKNNLVHCNINSSEILNAYSTYRGEFISSGTIAAKKRPTSLQCY